MTDTLIIRNVRPWGREPADIAIHDGLIARIAPGLAAEGPEEDGAGAIAIPGLVEAHTHLDKSLIGMGWRRHQAGPRLIDKIETERRLKKEWNIDPRRQSARQVALSVSHGTTAIRSHVDIDIEIGLRGFEGVAATREDYRDAVQIEIVAFPQSGLVSCPGTLELVDAALAHGADVVGGLDPCGIDRDPKGQLDAIFGLAEKHGKPIDIHLHEEGELGAFSMELIIERTRALGLQGKVTISHAFCLGMPDRDRARALTVELARERIAIATVATPSRPVPSAAELREAGVTLCAGSDGIRDTWGPYGNADMLERAMLLGLRNNFRRDEDVEHALWVSADLVRRWDDVLERRTGIALMLPVYHADEMADRDARTEIEAMAAEIAALRQSLGVLFTQDGHRAGSIALARSLGLLGPFALLSHSVELTPQDIAALKETGARVVHNPSAVMSIYGRCPAPELIADGVIVALGSDAAAPDRGYDMFRHME